MTPTLPARSPPSVSSCRRGFPGDWTQGGPEGASRLGQWAEPRDLLSWAMTSVTFEDRLAANVAGGVVRWADEHPVLAAGAIGMVLSVITWTSVPLAPSFGIDQSWQATLAMAAERALGGGGALVPGGATSGSRIQFTYGPLAFLTSNAVWYPGIGVASTVWMALVRVAAMGSLVWSLRRSFSLPAAIALAWVAGVAAFEIVTPEPLVGLACLWALVLSRAELSPRRQEALALCLGGFAGVGLLVKFSIGLVALVLALVAAWVPSGRRGVHVLEVGVGFVAMVMIGWLGTANPVGDLGTWLSSSAAITAGYTGAMGLELGRLAGDYWRAVVVAAAVLGFAILEMRRLRGAQRWGIGLVSVAALAAAFKMGFVRHNLHSLIYFGVAAMGLAGLRVTGNRPKAIFSLALCLVALLGLDTAGWLPRTSVSPVAGTLALARQVAVVSSPRGTIADARTAMQAAYALTPATEAEVHGRTTWVYPWEEALTWAYPHLVYDPPPNFQAYGAYTPSLDRTDARYLAGPQAPARILVQPDLALDNRLPQFNPPATRVSMMCNYLQESATTNWEVLRRIRPRCGGPHLIARVATGWDRWTKVPVAAPGDAIVATWAPLPTPAGATLAGLALRPPPVYVQLDVGASKAAEAYRFIPATAGEEHIVVPPSTLGSTGSYVPLDISRIRLRGGGLGPTSAGVTISFFEVAVSPR